MIINGSVLFGQQIDSVTGDGVSLKVKFYPKHKAETVILLHGGPGVPDDLLEVAEILKNNYQVITFNQRGTGNSFCKNCEYSINNYINDVDSILAFYKLSKVHLFGHSWGGLYAQIYAQERSERILSLFLCSPSSGTGNIWKQTEKEVLKFNKNSVSIMQWFSMGLNSFAGLLGNNSAYRRLFKKVIANYNSGYNVSPLNDTFFSKIFAKPINKTRQSIVAYPLLGIQETPSFKITITYGDNDIYGDSKSFVYKRFPTANAVIIKKSGHLPWLHNHNEFTIALKQHFL